MTNDYESTVMWVRRGPSAGLTPALATPGPDYQRICGSVSDLERLAGELRFEGERRATEHLDLRIISMLERKITRKLLAKSRRGRLPGSYDDT